MKKKILIAFVIISWLLLLGGCKKTANDDDDMIEIAREEIPIADADTIDIQIIGRIDKEKSSLVCFMTGNEYQGHSYFPIEFMINKREKYEFFKVYKMMKRGMDIYVEQWNDGYIFIVNNPTCKYIQIELENGERQLVEVGEFPFIFYFDSISMQYNFLDTNGNALY
ncbi:MAG: hypothetical protein K0R34_599 [Herbinix sp.]|nr:hypothetical protein [Herbinix sp.]